MRVSCGDCPPLRYSKRFRPRGDSGLSLHRSLCKDSDLFCHSLWKPLGVSGQRVRVALKGKKGKRVTAEEQISLKETGPNVYCGISNAQCGTGMSTQSMEKYEMPDERYNRIYPRAFLYDMPAEDLPHNHSLRLILPS